MAAYESARRHRVVPLPLRETAYPLAAMIAEGGLTPTVPGAYDIHAEGLVIPPTRIYARGVETPVYEFFLNNIRFPDGMRIDNAAMIAAMKVAERRITEMLNQYGRVPGGGSGTRTWTTRGPKGRGTKLWMMFRSPRLSSEARMRLSDSPISSCVSGRAAYSSHV